MVSLVSEFNYVGMGKYFYLHLSVVFILTHNVQCFINFTIGLNFNDISRESLYFRQRKSEHLLHVVECHKNGRFTVLVL